MSASDSPTRWTFPDLDVEVVIAIDTDDVALRHTNDDRDRVGGPIRYRDTHCPVCHERRLVDGPCLNCEQRDREESDG